MRLLLIHLFFLTFLLSSMERRAQEASKLLDTYQILFDRTPGFDKVMASLRTNLRKGYICNMQGHLFELEVAMRLIQQGSKVLAFGYRPVCARHCEFDIETHRLCIECKNIIMEEHHSIEKQCKQFLKEKMAASLLGKRLKIYFKNQISRCMRQWLREQGIQYIVIS